MADFIAGLMIGLVAGGIIMSAVHDDHHKRECVARLANQHSSADSLVVIRSDDYCTEALGK